MTTVEDRRIAILTVARPQMKRLTVEDVDAICELAIDDEGVTLAEMILHHSLWTVPEC
jgi:hypothetical protein